MKCKFQPPKIKFRWRTARPFRDCMVCGCFGTRRAELTNCDGLCLNYLLRGPLKFFLQTATLIFQPLSSKPPTLEVHVQRLRPPGPLL